MEKGKKYWIVYKIPGVHRLPRQAVLRFIEEKDGILFFDGRPLCGTQEIEKAWVQKWEVAPASAPIVINMRFSRER